MSGSRRVAQALDALRHGWPVRVAGSDGALDLLPVETAYVEGAPRFGAMLISSARAATLKLANQREAAAPHAPVLIGAAEPFDLSLAAAVADPALDLDWPFKGPFRAEHLEAAEAGALAMDLARLAGILPAYLLAERLEPSIEVACTDLAEFGDPRRLSIQSRAKLPIAAGEEAEIVAFRSRDDVREHAALILGRQTGAQVPLVRLHSECLTGDVFGSLKCDCGPQLDQALAAMAAEARGGHGWGALLYLRQEGRGIGLINKLRAYRLQDQGFDTVEANERLGLPAEARDLAVAARMLKLLGVERVRLLTNNPAKMAALESEGVRVIERVPHRFPATAHNQRYLATKRDRSGHFL